MINIAIIDDHVALQMGIKSFLPDDIHCPFSATSLENFIHYNNKNEIDVIILDLNFSDLSGITVLNTILDDTPQARIVVYSMRDSIATICSCYDAGAYGFISKAADTDLLIDAIRTVSQNECYFPPGVDQEIADFAFKIKNNIPQSTLTKSELETFIQLASGLSQEDIAANFGISLKSVKNRTLLIKHKLDIPLNRFTQVAEDFNLI